MRRAAISHVAPDADTVEALHRALTLLAFHGNSARGHAEQVDRCLDWSGEQLTKALRHAYALGDSKLVDKLGNIEDARLKAADTNDDLAAMVAELSRHVGKARDRADELDGGAAKALRGREAAILKKRLEIAATDVAAKVAPPPAVFMTKDIARQVEVVITDEAELSNGDRILLDGLDLGGYWQSRAVFLNHKMNSPPVAWCADILRRGSQLVATLQFAPRGQSTTSDRAWSDVKAGRLRCASIGYGAAEYAPDGVTVIRSYLKEISLCRVGANKSATITHIGGQPVDGQTPTGEFLSPYGIDNARAETRRLYASRWGLK